MPKFLHAAAALAVAFVGLVPASAQAPPAIEIVARNYTFSPNRVVLHSGVAQTLRFVSREGVHGIFSDALRIPKTALAPDETTTISVTPNAVGTYRVGCAIVCGPDHEAMQLVIDVEP